MSGENEKSEDLLKRAVRTKQGIDERIFCMRLIQGTFSTDTRTIITNTCMAASMAAIGYSEKLEKFDFKKFRAIKRIFGDIKDIKQSDYTKLRLPKRGPHDYSPPCGHIYPIPWSIEQSEKVYNSYIKPWVPQLVYFPEGIRKHRQKLTKILHANEYYAWGWGLGKGCNKILETVSPKEANQKTKSWIGKTCPNCNEKILEDEVIEDTGEYVINRPEWSFFWEASQYLAYEGRF